MTECFPPNGVGKFDPARQAEFNLRQTRYSPQWVTTDACTGTVTLEAWMSYPSGHTGTGFAAGTVLALYLNAKLKAFSNYHTHFAKQMAVVLPLIGALFIATTMIVDKVKSISMRLPSTPDKICP